MTDNSFHLQHNRSSLNYSPALINLTTSTTPNSPAQNPPPIAEPGVSTLLSGLQMDDPDRDVVANRHSQSIANLEAQVRRNEETIRKQSRDIKTLNSLLPLATEFSNHKSTNLQELLQIRSGVDVLNNSIDARLSRLENFGTQPAVKPEPPYHQHIFFSGSMKEVSRFNSTMRDTFARLPGHFSGEKHKILYIIGYFRASKDNSSDDCASTFGGVDSINNQWPNVTEAEDNWKAFESLRQGSTSIGDFNSAFNTLYLQLGINLEPKVVCDYYDKAVNEVVTEHRRSKPSVTPSSITPFAKGKKRESISEVDIHPNNKKKTPATSPVTSMVPEASTSAPWCRWALSFWARLCFIRCFILRGYVLTSSIDGRGSYGSKLTTVSVLVDSGASTSFIDLSFAQKNKLPLLKLKNPLQVRSFDGSMARSGDIVNYVQGDILVPIQDDKFIVTSVRMFVTAISSANIILGNTWLRNTDTIIGGSNTDIIICRKLSHSSMFPSTHISAISDSTGSTLLKEFSDVFVSDALSSLPPHRPGFDCEVNLKDSAIPPFGKMYNLSKSERDQLKEYVDENLKKGFIKVSSLSAAAPIFYVKVADLKAAFNLLRVAPGHKWKTAFRTPWGLYEYQVMPFGLANAPATFQRFIQHVLHLRNILCNLSWIRHHNRGFENEQSKEVHTSFFACGRPFDVFDESRCGGRRVIHVDSSGYAIAAVLSQPDKSGNNRPVSYFSRKLTDRERAWPIFDLELLAIVLAFEEWRAWLMGTSTPVIVYSDHANLQYFKTAKYLSPKQARWACFLDGFNMQIIQISGVKNPADGPSRREDFVEAARRCQKQTRWQGRWSLWMTSMPFFARNYTDDDLKLKGVVRRSGVVWHRDRVLVPDKVKIQILKMYHDAPTIGHPGIARTLSALTRTFSWPGVKLSVTKFVKSCDSCQRVKARRLAADGELVPMVPDPIPWSTIGMDMITKLPLSGGNDSILVVMIC
ncbi:hypothetical protein PSHT_08173 [Puccinia striiformis]|uniref:Reverse transcriptase n=1 Tax=Puccinia striiformis TaxID=27350 RepID=A0A2S4VRZ7_9BASI|nr:hypothetical protein PSHT_08173 [Puccinia striiformis]